MSDDTEFELIKIIKLLNYRVSLSQQAMDKLFKIIIKKFDEIQNLNDATALVTLLDQISSLIFEMTDVLDNQKKQGLRIYEVDKNGG